MATTIERPAAAAELFATNDVRVEGREKVSGRMKYTADVQRPNTLWAAFAVSPFAHAKILRIDTTAARAVAGVRAVLTGADIGMHRHGRNLHDWPVLALDRVLFNGDRVAAVAAETRAAAEQAAALIEVEYEELPALLDPAAAIAPGAPVLHPERATYFYKAFVGKEHPTVPHLNVQGTNRFRKGETDPAPLFASAHRVFEHTIQTPRQHAGYIEPRSTIVWIDEDGTVHVVTPNKTPFTIKEQLAHVCEIPKEKIVVEPSAIGGDFGGKGFTTDEYPCYFLARATGRPVRFVESYTDELRGAATRHAAQITLRTAVDATGKFLAHQSTLVLAGGAYAGGKPGPQLMPGNGYGTVPYQIPNVAIDISAVYTNTLPTAHVRAPMGPQIVFAWESHVDQIAEGLGIDKLELRLRNCLREGDTFPTGEKIRNPMPAAVLERLGKESGWGSPLPPNRGRGLSLACWHLGAGASGARMRLHADGAIEVIVGVPDQGAGAYTVVRRVAAAALGLPPEQIAVRRGTTDEAPADSGAGASRVTHVAGRAAHVSADLLRAAIGERTGTSTWSSPAEFAALAARACADGPLEVLGKYNGQHDSSHAGDFSFTGMCVEVEVDPATGAVTICNALAVIDVGTIINPIAHQGQVDGGFIYGLGNAAMEEMPLDENGKVTTLSLGEYKLPTIADIPPFRTVLVEAPLAEGPYGAKAAGELTNTGVPGALSNAVAAAVGVRLSAYPVTAERVYDALIARAATTPA